MTKLRAISVDDQPEICQEIQRLLEVNFPEIEMATVAHSAEEAIERCRLVRPDVLFLDIDLGPRSGLDVLNELETRPPYVLFVSGHQDYWRQAFRRGALYFIEKPIDERDFREAVLRVIQQQQKDEQFEVMERYLSHKQPVREDKILVNSHDDLIVIFSNNLIMIQAEGNYSTFHQESEPEKFLASKGIGFFDSMLQNDPRFFRTKRSFLVNTDKIIKVNKRTKKIHLKGNLFAEVSESKIEALHRRMRGE